MEEQRQTKVQVGTSKVNVRLFIFKLENRVQTGKSVMESAAVTNR
tara:strand:- start:40 stop:174 length:135 start_codon:yes stop_codon:yes gene_type:complete